VGRRRESADRYSGVHENGVGTARKVSACGHKGIRRCKWHYPKPHHRASHACHGHPARRPWATKSCCCCVGEKSKLKERERESVCVLNKSGEGVVLGWRACVLLWFDSEPKDVLSASRHPGVMLLAMVLATTSAQRPSSTVCVCKCHSGHQQSSCRLCARKIGSAGITSAC